MTDEISKLDGLSPLVYVSIMQKFARLLLFILLVAFAAGTVVQSASATTMSLKMALGDGSAMDMADCEGWGSDGDGGDGGLICKMACVAPPVANLSQESALMVGAGASPTGSNVYHLVGPIGPPEPYPPRTLI